MRRPRIFNGVPVQPEHRAHRVLGRRLAQSVALVALIESPGCFTAVTWVRAHGRRLTSSRKAAIYGWAYREGIVNGPKVGSAPPGSCHASAAGRSIPMPPMATSHHRRSRLSRAEHCRNSTAHMFMPTTMAGTFWSLRHSGNDGDAKPRQLFTDAGGISAFGVDPSNGDLLYATSKMRTDAVDQAHRLQLQFHRHAHPANLSATGAFTNLTTLDVDAGHCPLRSQCSVLVGQRASRPAGFPCRTPISAIAFQPERQLVLPHRHRLDQTF